MKHLESHIADTTADTMTEKERLNLSLKVYLRRHRLLLLALILGLGYSVAQMNHRDKVEGLDSRYRAVDPSGEMPAAYRCPTDGNIYRSRSEYHENCPSMPRI